MVVRRGRQTTCACNRLLQCLSFRREDSESVDYLRCAKKKFESFEKLTRALCEVIGLQDADSKSNNGPKVWKLTLPMSSRSNGGSFWSDSNVTTRIMSKNFVALV